MSLGPADSDTSRDDDLLDVAADGEPAHLVERSDDGELVGDVEPDTQPDRTIEVPPSTGEPRVDEAVAALAALDEVPTSEHADVFEDVHRRLHTALTELDTD